MTKTTYTGRGNSLETATEALYKEAGNDADKVKGHLLYEVTLQGPKRKVYTGVRSQDYGTAFASALESANVKTKTYVAHQDRYSLEVLATAEVEAKEEAAVKGKPSGAERKPLRTGQLTDKF